MHLDAIFLLSSEKNTISLMSYIVTDKKKVVVVASAAICFKKM